MEKIKNMTRRDFLKDAAYTTFAVSAGFSLKIPEKYKWKKETKVVLIRDEKVIDDNDTVNMKIISKMLDEGISRLFDVKNPLDAWKELFKPEYLVGIKTNVWSYLHTPKELEEAIRMRVIKAGVKEKNVAIQDRGILRNKIFMNAGALINVRPMRTHHWSGVGTCLKNYIMFVPRPSAYHGDACANLGAIWHLPRVKGKTKLNILVLLRPLFYGVGPHHFSRKYSWYYKGMIIGTEPATVDAVGLHILKLKRDRYFGEEKPFTPPPKHIFVADKKYNLGITDFKKIDIIKLGWEKDSLI